MATKSTNLRIPPPSRKTTRPSLISGTQTPDLWFTNLGKLLETQASKFAEREAIICPDQQRLTYRQFNVEVSKVAKGLLSLGICYGDRIGILAGNRVEYAALFFAAGRIGAIPVVLNTGYTPQELQRAARQTDIKAIFTSLRIGHMDNQTRLDMLIQSRGTSQLPDLSHIILIGREKKGIQSYQEMLSNGNTIPDKVLKAASGQVQPDDTCNLQFTSGTSGSPKAAQLSHINIINNGRFIGDRMGLTEFDIVCCPPPLFHCFGLVLGLMAVITHGSCIVFPSETFNAKRCMDSVVKQRCTMLHGVPTMFTANLAEADAHSERGAELALRGGIAAGSPVSRDLMLDIFKRFDMRGLTNVYGMTETSPASFMTSPDDPFEKRVSTVGRPLPHTMAKIIDPDGEIVPIGVRGELCVAGYLLQTGYWKNPEKTAEVMVADENGVLWMRTGDEACFDEDFYCTITGRLKDIIIRGGENIYPLEIEERLLQHPAISEASVVGIPDARYGETVGAFLKAAEGYESISLVEVRRWVHDTLARHKAPSHVFWLGDPGVGTAMPQTASGKIQKNKLRVIGDKISRLSVVAKF